jgi:hypothetical protein
MYEGDARCWSMPLSIQTAWAWAQRENGFGAPHNLDSLEGWIADPNVWPEITLPRQVRANRLRSQGDSTARQHGAARARERVIFSPC